MSKKDVYDFVSPYVGTQGAANGKGVLVTGGGTGIGAVSHTAVRSRKKLTDLSCLAGNC